MSSKEAKQSFSDLVEHLYELRGELIGFSESERAAILGAECSNYFLSVKLLPEIERIGRDR